MHVWICFTYLFWVKLAWKVLKMLTSIFALETIGYDFPKSTQEALKKDPKVVATLP